MKTLSVFVLLCTMVAMAPVPVFAGTCTGSKHCTACKNCRYCKHCAKNGGTCGVCKK